MKITTEILKDFVNDFKLESEDETICFYAVVDFVAGITIQLLSEVHIVALQNDAKDVVYLLSPDIPKCGMPDMLTSGHLKFIYGKERGLIVEGHSPLYGGYILSICTINNLDKPATAEALQLQNV